MAVIKQQRHKQWAASILQAEISPLDKVRKLVALGYDEQEAEAMVNGVQTGQNQLVYYEQLPNPEYAQEQ
jgi:Holliday junction resolvasome RuvABC DNA-binding subunit